MEDELLSELAEELDANFMSYAEKVNEDRSIPDARSGLKPVARRIMWDMYSLGLSPAKPHVKSARVVGDTLARWHPHGDSSVYGAMVRLAQPWIMRYPLVDFHGNYGSVSGDGPAASRYTEVRLSKIAEAGITEGLKNKVVNFMPNYSEDEEEPITMPALFPNLLCNPTSGIGVAIASSWLPHNLTEVIASIKAYVENNSITTKELVDNYLHGPDFPLGGRIINKNNLVSCYETGRGRVVVQARYDLETRGKKTLMVFKELPYGVNSEDLLEEINKLYVAEKLTGIDAVRDESNKNGIRIVVEIARGGNATSVAAKLYKETKLQSNSNFNQVALVDKVPTLLSLKDALKIYVSHQIDVITNEVQFDLNKAENRLEIVDGLLIALEDIDNVIKLIKESKSSADARIQLKTRYALTDNQTKAIVDMKLGRIAGLEAVEVQNEQKELLDKIRDCKNILASEHRQNEILLSRLDSFVKKYGDSRRTELANIEIPKEEKIIEAIEPEDVVVLLTKGGHIKRIPVKSFKVQKRNGKGIKNKDDSILDIIKTNTIDTLIMFSSLGKIYRIVVDDVPECTNTAIGESVNNLVKLSAGEEIIAITSHYRKSTATSVVFITAQGMVKKTSIDEYSKGGRTLVGLIGIKLKTGDKIANITLLDKEDLILITKNGMSIRIATDIISPIGRIAMGVKGIKLADGDEVVAGVPVHKDTDSLAIFTEEGIGKKVSVGEFVKQGRGGIGNSCYKGHTVIGATMVSDDDNILIIGAKNSICISAKEIPLVQKVAIGNAMIKNDNIKSIVKI